ncbi:hypothetical protein ACFV80_46050 [Streptomyces sp. NPDC059862]|uniref:hypothetical protein n=1 Tax=Streptomyces sp. NPDC059862 TaxID=3346975 RepID=UPI003668D1EE
MTVKDCVTPEAVGHLGIGMVVRLITGVKKPQEIVHERILGDLQPCWRRFLPASSPKEDASAEEVEVGAEVDPWEWTPGFMRRVTA